MPSSWSPRLEDLSSTCHLQELKLGGDDNNHSFQRPKDKPIDFHIRVTITYSKIPTEFGQEFLLGKKKKKNQVYPLINLDLLQLGSFQVCKLIDLLLSIA